MEHKDIQQLTSTEVYRNNWMSIREDTTLRSDGALGIYGVVDKPDFAIVIPYADGGFWMVEQFRYPIQRRAWEFPQGSWATDSAGSQDDLARSELREETGILAGHLQHLGHCFGAYGYSSQGFDIYLATALTLDQPDREHTERDMIHDWVSEEAFVEMIRTGAIVDAATITAYTLLRNSPSTL